MQGVYELMAQAAAWVRPEMMLLLLGSVYFLAAVFVTARSRTWAIVSLLIVMLAAAMLPGGDQTFATPASFFRNDSFSHFFRGLSLAVGALIMLLSWDRIPDRYAAEYFGCLLLILAGVNLVAAANDLVALFLALELVSIPTYVLLYLLRSDDAAQEAILKYFFLSLFSSALLLYGLSFLYGATGSTNLEVLRGAVRNWSTQHHGMTPLPMPTTMLIALIMIVAALGFRITAAPFHFYAPDVYQGAPLLPVTLLSVVPKLAGFAAMYQIVSASLLIPGADQLAAPLAHSASGLFWIMALVSMFIGNLMGLWQNNLKRLLAYSGIAHAGYMLVGLGTSCMTGMTVAGLAGLFFYLIIYSVMTLGVFAVLIGLQGRGQPVQDVDDLAGLGKSHPLLALAMAGFLFCLMGLPPTAGFLAKLNLFLAAWNTEQRLYRILALVMAVNAAIGAWYYLRIISVMFLRDAVKPLTARLNWPTGIVVLLCLLTIFWLFFQPNGTWTWMETITQHR